MKLELGPDGPGTNFEIAGRKQLGVIDVTFHAAKQKEYVRSVGAELEFDGYTGSLPGGLTFGASRDAVRKKLGKPEHEYDDSDAWRIASDRRLFARFTRGKLVEVSVGIPRF